MKVITEALAKIKQLGNVIPNLPKEAMDEGGPARYDEGGPVRYIVHHGIGFVSLDDLVFLLRHMGDDAQINSKELRESLEDLRGQTRRV